MMIQSVTRNGERCSTSKAFLWPNIDRPNFHISPRSHATKILIEKKKAVGVEYVKDGRLYTVKAKREIILSGGAIGSPQLLMLSGVGPKKHLESLGIPVKADLPVGENLQDHMLFVMHFSVKDPITLVKPMFDATINVARYKAFRSGHLTSTGGLDGTAFMKTDPAERSPDMQLHFLSTILGDDFYSLINIVPEIRNVYANWTSERDGFTILPTLLRPKSVGNILLKSTNPFEYPLIDPNYLSDIADVKTLIRGVRVVQKFGRTKAFQKVGAVLDQRPFPKCTSMKFDSDEYWECYIRATATTIYHPAGTCKMGRADDKTTVVDAQLRVKGISGLRVADASVMPDVMSGNTNAPSIMIGEKAADMIKTANQI